MNTHPPIFTAMCRRLSPRHPVNILARRIAFTEHREPVLETRLIYRPRGWDQHHDKDLT
jgi:hypothetical protein